jgi:hypothetical protein
MTSADLFPETLDDDKRISYFDERTIRAADTLQCLHKCLTETRMIYSNQKSSQSVPA